MTCHFKEMNSQLLILSLLRKERNRILSECIEPKGLTKKHIKEKLKLIDETIKKVEAMYADE